MPVWVLCSHALLQKIAQGIYKAKRGVIVFRFSADRADEIFDNLTSSLCGRFSGADRQAGGVFGC